MKSFFTPGKVHHLISIVRAGLSAGPNRISFHIQSFCQRVYSDVGRTHRQKEDEHNNMPQQLLISNVTFYRWLKPERKKEVCGGRRKKMNRKGNLRGGGGYCACVHVHVKEWKTKSSLTAKQECVRYKKNVKVKKTLQGREECKRRGVGKITERWAVNRTAVRLKGCWRVVFSEVYVLSCACELMLANILGGHFIRNTRTPAHSRIVRYLFSLYSWESQIPPLGWQDRNPVWSPAGLAHPLYKMEVLYFLELLFCSPHL